jgi:hypothetical protein
MAIDHIPYVDWCVTVCFDIAVANEGNTATPKRTTSRALRKAFTRCAYQSRE